MSQDEKKVEYIELVFDLIFVYIIGRSNNLLHVINDGFIDAEAFMVYGITAFIMLQIWYYTTLFVNRYGQNDRLMHAAIFVNMYLLYYMARDIRTDWRSDFYTFHIAWILILLNLAFLYIIQLKKTNPAAPWELPPIRLNIITIFLQIGIILLSMMVFYFSGIALSALAMLCGIVIALGSKKVSLLMPVDFGHLTERVMLYVVFTFGEMIIGITDYFEGELDFGTIYFSLFAFLIVAGLFLSYGIFYDRLLDREAGANGTMYMMVHVFLIMSLNHVTAALEFMRDPDVLMFPKTLFLVISLVLYFLSYYFLMAYNKTEYKPTGFFSLVLFLCTALFAVLMLVFYRHAVIGISMTFFYIWLLIIYLWLLLYKRKK